MFWQTTESFYLECFGQQQRVCTWNLAEAQISLKVLQPQRYLWQRITFPVDLGNRGFNSVFTSVLWISHRRLRAAWNVLYISRTIDMLFGLSLATHSRLNWHSDNLAVRQSRVYRLGSGLILLILVSFVTNRNVHDPPPPLPPPTHTHNKNESHASWLNRVCKLDACQAGVMGHDGTVELFRLRLGLWLSIHLVHTAVFLDCCGLMVKREHRKGKEWWRRSRTKGGNEEEREWEREGMMKKERRKRRERWRRSQEKGGNDEEGE